MSTISSQADADRAAIRAGDAGNFSLPMPEEASRRLASGWLWLGVASLLGAGFFAILLVLSRTPYVQDVFPWVDFFHTALVVHVDLSVIVWFLAFAGVLWSLNASSRGLLAGQLALVLAALGTALIVAAPFVGAGNPLMSNYVPVLRSPLFLTGLVVLAQGIALLVVRSFVFSIPIGGQAQGSGALRFGLNAAAVATVFALVAFGWSFAQLPTELPAEQYYELLFWGGGHVLQFAYTLLLLIGWLWLASASGVRVAIGPRMALIFFLIALAPVFATPFIYLMHDALASSHTQAFTTLMKVGGSLASLPLGLAVAYALATAPRSEPETRPLRAALLCSVVLFAVGGGISFMIEGSNTIITAHYHGTGGAISLAFMGLAFLLLPQLGYRTPELKLARWQPYVYGAGQLLHIIGLLWSGGYGVQRKVAGAAQELTTLGQKAGMGLMGLGGLIAIIGGLMFLIIVLRAMWGGARR